MGDMGRKDEAKILGLRCFKREKEGNWGIHALKLLIRSADKDKNRERGGRESGQPGLEEWEKGIREAAAHPTVQGTPGQGTGRGGAAGGSKVRGSVSNQWKRE